MTPEERGRLEALAEMLELATENCGDGFTRSTLLHVATRLRSLAVPEARNRA